MRGAETTPQLRQGRPRRRNLGLGALVLAAALVPTGSAAPALQVDTEARAIQPGELVLVAIAGPADAAPPRVTAFDHEAVATTLEPGHWRALVGVDLDAKPGRYRLTVEAGSLRDERDLIVKPKIFRTRRLTVDPDFVTPPPAVEARIEREAQLLHTIWNASPPRALWTEPFTRPVREMANSAFGTRSIFNGLPRNAHGGADFLSAAGTPVHAPNAGQVVLARDLYFSGNTVIIDHGAGLFSMLAHLSTIDVREGDRAANDQVVGRVGATGRVTGPHLHWAVRVANARVDPLSLLALLGRK